MRGSASLHDLETVDTLDELFELLADNPGERKLLAGGTDVMVVFASGKLADTELVDIWKLDELRGISVTPDAITFGALTTYTDVQEHEVVRRELPMMCQAASETGGWAIQNRGTLGGNIANASPAADSPPALLAYGAEIELGSKRGYRWLDYATFHTGYKKTLLRPDELITRIRVPRPTGERVHFYRKVGPRRAQAISKICFAACADVADGRVTGVKMALGGVAPIIPRCPRTEAAVVADPHDEPGAQTALAAEIAPIDDIRSTARYRRQVAGNLLGDFMRQLRG